MRTPTSPIPMALAPLANRNAPPEAPRNNGPIERPVIACLRRQCCSGASNVCHPCLPRRGPNKCLHKKFCTRMFTPLEHMRICTGLYRCKDCLLWKVNAVIDLQWFQCSTPGKVLRVDTAWVHSARQCWTLLYDHVWLCMTLWFHDLLRSSSKIFFEAFSKPSF